MPRHPSGRTRGDDTRDATAAAIISDMAQPKSPLGILITERLEALNWTVKQGASACGLQYGTFSAYKTGRITGAGSSTSVDTLKAIARGLKLDEDDVFRAASNAAPIGSEEAMLGLWRRLPTNADREVAFVMLQAMVRTRRAQRYRTD